jgi:hypothetical protein
MTDQEKKDTLDNMLVCYVDRTYLTNKQIEESEIFVEELRAAISVTRCCTELKDKKVISFNDWLEKLEWKQLGNSYTLKKGNSYSDVESLLRVYTKEHNL